MICCFFNIFEIKLLKHLICAISIVNYSIDYGDFSCKYGACVSSRMKLSCSLTRLSFLGSYFPTGKLEAPLLFFGNSRSSSK